MILVQQGKIAPAIELLEKLLATAPSNLKALNLMGIALAASGRRVEAGQRFEKAVATNPNFVPALKNLAANELALGKRKQAQSHFEAAAKLAPADPMVNLALAEFAYEARRFSDAATGYGKGGDLLYRDPAVVLRYATACVESERRKEAVAAIMRIDRPAGAQAHFAAGLLLTRLEEYEGAAQRFEWAETNSPDPYNAGYNAALAWFRAGKFEETIRVGNRLKPPADRQGELLNLVAQAHEKAGRTKEAYESLRKATEINPRDEINYLDLIGLCLEHQNYELGIEIAEIGLKLIPESHRIQLVRGVIYATNGRLELAEKDFAQAAEEAPPEASLPIVSRGLMLLQMNRASEAVGLFRKRAQSHANDYLVHWFLAEALIRQGAATGSPEEQEATIALQSSIRQKPEVPQTHLMLGKLLLKRGDLTSAAKHLEAAMRLDPKDTSAIYQLGTLYRRQGNAKRAAELFAKVGKAKSEEQDQANAGTILRIIREGSK